VARRSIAGGVATRSGRLEEAEAEGGLATDRAHSP
jgi:hypothetical protein